MAKKALSVVLLAWALGSTAWAQRPTISLQIITAASGHFSQMKLGSTAGDLALEIGITENSAEIVHRPHLVTPSIFPAVSAYLEPLIEILRKPGSLPLIIPGGTQNPTGIDLFFITDEKLKLIAICLTRKTEISAMFLPVRNPDSSITSFLFLPLITGAEVPGITGYKNAIKTQSDFLAVYYLNHLANTLSDEQLRALMASI